MPLFRMVKTTAATTHNPGHGYNDSDGDRLRIQQPFEGLLVVGDQIYAINDDDNTILVSVTGPVQHAREILNNVTANLKKERRKGGGWKKYYYD